MPDANLFKIDRKNAAKLLKVTVRTVDRYIAANKVSHVRNDGRIWLDKKELMAFRNALKVDNVDTSMSMDDNSGQGGARVDFVSTERTSKITEKREKHASDIFKNLYEELREEFRRQQSRLEGANYRVGQLEGILKESIPLRDHQHLLGTETAKRLELEESIESLRDNLEQSEIKLKDEKFSRRVILGALYFLLLMQPLWLLLFR